MTIESKETVDNFMTVYHVVDMSIELISDATAYGWQTVAEVAGEYHYLGDEAVSLETAINLYQHLIGRTLSQQEIQFVMDDNVLRLGVGNG